jgi:hypothetical protein
MTVQGRFVGSSNRFEVKAGTGRRVRSLPPTRHDFARRGSFLVTRECPRHREGLKNQSHESFTSKYHSVCMCVNG